MRIAIDCKILCSPGHSGIKTYLINLLFELDKIDKENTYLLFLPRPVSLLKNKNFIQIYPHKILSSMPWQILLPVLSFLHRSDIFHMPGQHGVVGTFHPRIVVTVHDLLDEVTQFNSRRTAYVRLMSAYLNFLRSSLIRQSKAIIVESRYVQRQLISKNVTTPISCIYLGVTGYYAPISSYEKSLQRRYILTMTDLSKRKNVERLFRAYAGASVIIRRKYPLHVVLPKINVNDRFIQLIKKLRIVDSVRFHENPSDNELMSLYQQASFFVYASLSEGFGLPILEAMACGCPVITSNRTATKEIAGDAAYTVNPFSVRDIRRAIQRLAKGPLVARNLRSKGLKRAKEFTWERTARKTLLVYKDLV